MPISILWKIFGAFTIVSLLPVLCYWLEFSFFYSFIVSGLSVIFFSWYTAWRILSTITRLGKSIPEIKQIDNKIRVFGGDELVQIEENFGALFSSLEENYSNEESAEIDEKAIVENRLVFKSELSTGEPVFGQIKVIPLQEGKSFNLFPELNIDQRIEVFTNALIECQGQLEEILCTSTLDTNHAGIIEFQVMLLKDPEIKDEVLVLLNRGEKLKEALVETFGVFISALEKSKNEYLRARKDDCFDLMYRLENIIYEKIGVDVSDIYKDIKGKIVFKEKFFPSEVISLRNAGVIGIVSITGTETSHAQILLNSFDLASISSLPEDIVLMSGMKVLLHTSSNELIVNPNDLDMKVLHDKRKIEENVIDRSVQLENGEQVFIGATVNMPHDASYALSNGADGIGLYRSEMRYLSSSDLPTEEELFNEYSQLVHTFEGAPVVLRLLDLGGDKISDLDHSILEENPCMGLRSMRLLIANPNLFRVQIRAMLRAANSETTLLFPMISGIDELCKIKKMVESFKNELLKEGVEIESKIKYGIMVEVPSVVERFEDYINEVDVFNIGTNDLTQYVLAVDRNNNAIAEYFNSVHPSILSMISRICSVVRENKKTACICGEMANNEKILPLLIGLGVRHLSVKSNQVSSIKAKIEKLDVQNCVDLAKAALACPSVSQVESLLNFEKNEFYKSH